ncbi:MAG: SLC13 family permease [Chloroflexi bacterium HGW-Chloroflexi-10]|nr:MAG: SLC13 family permease [Chloroflexi bacterium HGW-Chloroflexi-10]
MNQQTLIIIFLSVILFLPLGLVLLNRLRMDLAAIIMAIALAILQLFGWGMIGPSNSPEAASNSLTGFSQPVVFTLIALFIISRGLEKSGVTRGIAQQLVKVGGQHERLMIGLFASVTAFLSLFMNNLAAAALLLPSAMEVSRQTRIKPSRLLIPVSFGSLLGGSATYFTTANIIISDLLTISDPPQERLGFLDFTPTGGLIAIAGLLFLTLWGKFLLKEREPSTDQVLARYTGRELEDFYQIGERLWVARVLPSSSFVRRSISNCDIGKKWGVAIAATRRGREEYTLPMPDQIIMPGDELLIIGREEKISAMGKIGLEIRPDDHEHHLSVEGVVVAEALIGPHSRVEGQTLKEIEFRKRFGLTVVALRRLNRSYRTDVGEFQLQFGDSLLVIGNSRQMEDLKKTSDFIVLESNPADQPLNKRDSILSVTIMVMAISASIAGVPVFIAMLCGAILTILLGLLTMEEAYRSIEWQAIFVIAGMYVVSLALVQTGMADLVGQYFLVVVQPFGAIGVALGAYIISMLVTQLMGSQVTALVTGPIVISAALTLGVNPQAVAVAAAIGCSASFLTPMAHPVNILMIGPANYKFTDFLRLGWVMVLISFAMLIVGLKLFWGL